MGSDGGLGGGDPTFELRVVVLMLIRNLSISKVKISKAKEEEKM